MLEREFVNVLLREMYLDLAGLTEGSATNVLKPMQAAYWIVDGLYQSYETTNLQVEIVLDVRRMFGRNQQVQLREKAGEPLFQSVKSTIDAVMDRDKAALLFSRATEVKAQLHTGLDLARIAGDHTRVHYEGYSPPPKNEMARRVRNAREAIRCFETVLLLDPTNREARVCLATCLRKSFNDRFDDAREYYRQVIDAPVEDQWSRIARDALVRSFEWPNPSQSKVQWFVNAAQSTTNSTAIAFYKAQMKEASEDAVLEPGTPQAERLAEQRLFKKIKAFDDLIHTGSGMFSASMGMDYFASELGEAPAVFARRLTDLYPKIKVRFPDLAPFALASIIRFQVDTNAAIFAEFERTLEWCVNNSSKIPQKGTTFWSHLNSAVYYWASEHKYHGLALKVLEATGRAAAFDPAAKGRFDEDYELMELAFCYMDCQRWSNALSILEPQRKGPIEMSSGGTWGPGFTTVWPHKQAALCREKLGLPLVTDPREFDLGEPCLHLHKPKRYSPTGDDNPAIAVAAEGLWIGSDARLMHLDFDLKTNLVLTLPLEDPSAVRVILADTARVWLGTQGSGLIEFDKTTKETRKITEKDGLLMNYISALHESGDTLWIGYGMVHRLGSQIVIESGSRGGLGSLDLKTRQFTSFSASLHNTSSDTNPPRTTVTDVRSDSTGDIWFVTGSRLMRYQTAEQTWSPLRRSEGIRTACYELDRENLIEALGLSQVEVTIETQLKAGQTDPGSATKQLLTLDESVRLQATLKTNGSGTRARVSKRGALPYRVALETRALRTGTARSLLDADVLPGYPTTLTLAGRDLWVGGQGYVALVNLEENKIKKLAYISAPSVDRIHLGGGYLWVQCDKHLYRARL